MSDLIPPEPPLHPEAAFALEVTRRQWLPLALVLAIAAVGVVLVFVNFRLGALTLAAAAGLGAFLRWTRSEEEVGLLALRAAYIDVAVMGFFAIGLAVLGLWVPLI